MKTDKIDENVTHFHSFKLWHKQIRLFVQKSKLDVPMMNKSNRKSERSIKGQEFWDGMEKFGQRLETRRKKGERGVVQRRV